MPYEEDSPYLGKGDVREQVRMWFRPKCAAHPGHKLPGARAAHSCHLIQNKLFLFGGWNGREALNDLFLLDLDSMMWREVKVRGVSPSTRNNHTITYVDGLLYIHGGHDGSKWLDDFHALNVVDVGACSCGGTVFVFVVAVVVVVVVVVNLLFPSTSHSSSPLPAAPNLPLTNLAELQARRSGKRLLTAASLLPPGRATRRHALDANSSCLVVTTARSASTTSTFSTLTP